VVAGENQVNMRRIVSAVLLLAAFAAQAQEPTWVGTWGASPLPPSAAAGPFPATPSFNDQTVRQIVRVSVGGERVRLRLTNEYGAKPLTIGAARVALADGADRVKDGTEQVVTFDGRPSAIIPAGAPLLSDPIDLKLSDLAMLSVSVYLQGDTGPCTCHATGMQDAYVSAKGDFTRGTFAPAQTIQVRAFLSGIEVLAPRAQAVVVLGDSISDGVGSTVGTNRRWPDLFAERLSARRGGVRFGVVNHGVSGNQVLSDGAGESALARFDRDVLSVPGVSHVIVFEGVNDLGLGYGRLEGPIAALMPPPAVKPTRESMIAAYRQLIARAHAKGLEIYGATIAPYEGAAYYATESDAVRQAINDWIRTSKEFDGVLDFDAVLRDPAKPTQMKAELHSGDHLHGSDAGYRAVADSIDLGLLR
jgi:lysophospholipase L1-like esterase/antitoxin (DNA-binding transcriptional repressor) of toxin-antitoxin stability system